MGVPWNGKQLPKEVVILFARENHPFSKCQKWFFVKLLYQNANLKQYQPNLEK
jgi:hypothetical protein